MDLQTAIGLSELEIPDEEVVDVGVLGDAAGAVADIAEPAFFQIVLVQGVIQPIIRIVSLRLVFGANRCDTIFAAVFPKPYRAEPHQFVAFLLDDSPVVEALPFAFPQILLEDFPAHWAVVDRIIGVGLLYDGIAFAIKCLDFNYLVFKGLQGVSNLVSGSGIQFIQALVSVLDDIPKISFGRQVEVEGVAHQQASLTQESPHLPFLEPRLLVRGTVVAPGLAIQCVTVHERSLFLTALKA